MKKSHINLNSETLQVINIFLFYTYTYILFYIYIYILFYTYIYILFYTCIYFLFYTYIYIFITEIAGNDFLHHRSMFHSQFFCQAN